MPDIKSIDKNFANKEINEGLKASINSSLEAL